MPADTIRLDSSLDREMVRLFRGQLRRAHRSLRQQDDRSVHTARKAVKRSRAILRLVRPGLRPDRYRQVDRGVRAVGRQLGPIRDATVALGVTDRLLAEGVLTLDGAERLSASVRASAAESRARLEAGGLEALRTDLRGLELTDDDLIGLDVAHLTLGLAGTYARGRQRLADALAEPTSEALHTWRRQVKHHGAHVSLLVPVWPPVLRSAARAIGTLSDALGDDHDLAEFARLATLARLPRRDLRSVRAALQTQRAAFQATAWPLGACIYAETPAAFADRLTAYLASARDRASPRVLSHRAVAPAHVVRRNGRGVLATL